MTEIQIIIIYHFRPIRLKKMNDSINVDKGREQWEASYNFSDRGNWCRHLGEQFGSIWLEENEQPKYFQ